MQRSSWATLRSSTGPKVLICICSPSSGSVAAPAGCQGGGSTTGDFSCESPLLLCSPTFGEQLLPVGVQQALGLECLTEASERREERLDLVQRVGPLRGSRDVELEVDPVGAVRELENRPRVRRHTP